MTGGLVDPNLREALFLLNKAVTEFFKQDGTTLAPGEATPSAAAPDQFTPEFVMWLVAMLEAKIVDRRELEQIFSVAESNADSPPVLKAISDMWDKIVTGLPAPSESEYVGSVAESTGDYSRLHFPKPWIIH